MTYRASLNARRTTIRYFEQYALLADTLTQQFWAQHYPGGDLEDVGSDYDELRQQAGEMIDLILASVPPGKPADAD